MHKKENRHNPRFPCGMPAKLEGPRGVVKGHCRDLSMGGFFFLGQTFPIGKSFDFRIELPQGTVSGNAEVRYHHQYEGGIGMGLKFSRISQDQLAIVAKFIEASGT